MPLRPFSAILKGMATYKDTVMIKDGGKSRAVKVTIDAPQIEGLDIQTLALDAWIKPGKKLKTGNITVKVEKFAKR